MAISLLGLAAFAPVPPALAQQATGASNEEPKVTYDLDPNAPGLTRRERIRRQEGLIRQRMQKARERRQREAQERARRAREHAQQVTGDAKNKVAAERQAARGKEPAVAERAAEAEPTQGAKIQLGSPGADFSPVTFYLSPATLIASADEEFITEAHLLNLHRARVDRIELVFQYPPELLEPVAVHQDRIADQLRGEPEFEIDAEAGEIHYRAQLKRPLVAVDSAVLSVRWKALVPADRFQIELAAGENCSAAYQGRFRLTRNEFGDEGLLCGTSVRIDAAAGAPRHARLPMGSSVAHSNVGSAPPSDSEDAAPRLRLDYPEAESYRRGEWLVFDIVLENPDLASFDELRVSLQFDPEDIKFVDTDEGNLIRRGTNLADGPFSDAWHWTRLHENSIDAQRGKIRYRVGYSLPSPRATGVVARMIGQVQRRVEGAPVRWLQFKDPHENSNASGVYLAGRNLMEEPAEISAAAGLSDRGEISIGAIRVSPSHEKADPAVYRSR